MEFIYDYVIGNSECEKPIKIILQKMNMGTVRILKLLFISYLQIIKSRKEKNHGRSDRYCAREENRHFHFIVSSMK